MARRKKGTIRTMGQRSVTLTFTLTARESTRITDNAWNSLQDAIDRFIEDVDANTKFTTPIIQQATYNREVEVRDIYHFE